MVWCALCHFANLGGVLLGPRLTLPALVALCLCLVPWNASPLPVHCRWVESTPTVWGGVEPRYTR